MELEIKNNLIRVDNYKQILDIASDLIILENVKISGNSLRIVSMDKHSIIISGNILNISFRNWENQYEI